MPTLETLPTELRSLIWNAVGEEEDFSSLLVTSRTIRNEILRSIPGAFLSCGCPNTRPCRCGKGFDIDHLTIVVDSVCSERHWLKFSVRRTRRAIPSVWCVADLDTPLVRALRYCRPRETVIKFQPLERKPVGATYMILRAQLFDVCEVLSWFQVQRERVLQIRFADPPPPTEGGVPLMFWECRMTHRPNKFDIDIRGAYYMRKVMDPDLWPFVKRPTLYETLLLPLILNSAWRNAEIVFDRDPRKISSTFVYSMSRRGMLVKSESFDYKLLSLTAWAYMDQLIHDGAVSLGDDDLTPYFQQYEDNVRAWAAEKAHRRTLQAAFHSSLLAMIDCSYVFDLFLEQCSLNPSGPVLDPIRSHIRRTRNMSSANSFSKDRPDTEAAGWPWNLDPIRQDFVFWAMKDGVKSRVEGQSLPDWRLEDSAKVRFLRWRNAHTPLWPKPWQRNWPPLKKKMFVNDSAMTWLFGSGPE